MNGSTQRLIDLIKGVLGLGTFIGIASALAWAAGMPRLPRFDDFGPAVSGCAVLGAWACLVWIALGTVVSALATLPGVLGRGAHSVSMRIAPPLVRRVVGAAMGAAVVTAPVLVPAAAAEPADVGTPPSVSEMSPSQMSPSQVLASLPSLDRPGAGPTVLALEPTVAPGRAPDATPSVEPAPETPDEPAAQVEPAPTAVATPVATPEPVLVETPPAAPSPKPAATKPSNTKPTASAKKKPAPPAPRPIGGDTYVVARGDSLWAIAARHLPVGASASDIAQSWPRWYEANREVIGEDPNLILPGQVLLVPATAAGVNP